MKKKRIYLCGKISGMPWGTARASFEKAERELSKEYEVCNPIKICPVWWTWEECMKQDLGELLKCDAIYLMHNWRESKGAKIEQAVAAAMGIEEINEN